MNLSLSLSPTKLNYASWTYYSQSFNDSNLKEKRQIPIRKIHLLERKKKQLKKIIKNLKFSSKWILTNHFDWSMFLLLYMYESVNVLTHFEKVFIRNWKNWQYCKSLFLFFYKMFSKMAHVSKTLYFSTSKTTWVGHLF